MALDFGLPAGVTNLAWPLNAAAFKLPSGPAPALCELTFPRPSPGGPPGGLAVGFGPGALVAGAPAGRWLAA